MSLIVDIKKKIGNFNLEVNFTAEDEVFALLGASGCGKSMTLKCIAGIENPDEGRIILNERILFDSHRKINLCPQERRVGYLFQQYSLFPNMTVAQNIACGVRTKEKAKKHALVEEMIASMQLTGHENKRPHQLSGGQQQRAALARILVNQPDILLLDEPFSALDNYLKWQLELELSATLASFKRPAIFVSHNRNEVYRLCDRVCVLSEGHSEEPQTVAELFERPRSINACLLTGCKNFSRIEVLNHHTVQALDWAVALHVKQIPDGSAYLGVHSHLIEVSTLKRSENSFLAQVKHVIDELGSSILILSVPGSSSAYSHIRVKLDKAEWNSLNRPKELWINIAPDNIMLLHA